MYFYTSMGCLKLSYGSEADIPAFCRDYEQERALEVNPVFFTPAVEKNDTGSKNCLNSSTYGFNGKEKDDEWTGTSGATYDYGFRIYDARIAKFLSVDPLTKSYPWYTPYQFAGNKPIENLDLDGLEEIKYYEILDEKNAVIGKMTYLDVESSFFTKRIKGYSITHDGKVISHTDSDWDAEVPNNLGQIFDLYKEYGASGGYRFTWKGVGQGEETRRGKGNIESTDISDIMSAFGQANAASGTKAWKNVAAGLGHLVNMFETGQNLAEVIKAISNFDIDLVPEHIEINELKEQETPRGDTTIKEWGHSTGGSDFYKTWSDKNGNLKRFDGTHTKEEADEYNKKPKK